MRGKDSRWQSDLEPLFNPRSVAVVGISGGSKTAKGADKSKMGMGANAVINLLDFGYKGKIYPVNPKYEEILGLKCYKQISEIPGEVDSIFIAISSEGVIPVLQEAGEKGIKAAIIFTSGFAEIGGKGRELQEEMAEICEENQIRLCGPNNMGLVSFRERFWLLSGDALAFKDASPGGFSFIGQSGTIPYYSMVAAKARGIGYSYLVTSGNEAVLEASDYLRFLLDDPQTKVVGCFIEGFKDPEKFKEVSETALAKNKPIIMLKIGRSPKGQQAALSHTGSLTGSDAVQDAFFKQKGIIRVDGIEELVETAELFLKTTLPKRNRMAFISMSGGESGIVSDLCDQYGIYIPELSEETKAALRPIFPAFGNINNPLDVTGYGYRNPEMHYETIEILLKEDVDIIGLEIEIPWIESLFWKVNEFSKKTEKLLCFFSLIHDELDDKKRKMWRESAVPILQEMTRGLKSIRSLIRYSEFIEERKLVEPAQVTSHQTRDEATKFLSGCGKKLNEFESKRLLQLYGIPVTIEDVAGSVDEAVNIVQRIGYPVALKIQSREISHKTEAGGVLLNIRDEAELRSGYEKLLGRVRQYNSDAAIEGVLVQEMIENGIEFILGMSQDNQFGPYIIFGLGGIYVEALRDISLRVVPVAQMDAISMMKEIRSYKILQGFRGRPPINIKTLSNIIVTFSKLALDFKDKIAEIDINPLVVYPETNVIKAVDALVIQK